MAKLPQHVVQTTFSKLVKDASKVGSSGFVLNGKCPLCNDYKKRMYLKEYADEHMIYCHNCGYSNSFPNFLKEEFPHEWDQAKIHFLDSIKDGSIFKRAKKEPKKTLKGDLSEELKQYLKKHGFSIVKEQRSSKKEAYRQTCLKYVIDRKIPEEVYSDWWCVYKGPLCGYIAITFFNEDKSKMIHIQGRKVIENNKNKNKPKYLFLKDEAEGIVIDSKPLWGLWRVDKTKPVIMCEGTLDACAFRNGVATCGVTMSKWFVRTVKKQFPKIIWSLDNYYSDKAGREAVKKLLLMDEVCFNLPKSCKSKDSNAYLKEAEIDFITDRFVFENCFKGKTGLTKLKLSCLKTG